MSHAEPSEFPDSKVAVGAALTFIEDLQVRSLPLLLFKAAPSSLL